MALTERKKKGLTYMVSGGLTLGVGVVLFTLTNTPDWVPVAVQIVGAVAAIFGVTVVYPDTD